MIRDLIAGTCLELASITLPNARKTLLQAWSLAGLLLKMAVLGDAGKKCNASS